MRQVVLDTETTGLEPSSGHRIIEIGGVEIVDRRLTGRHYHQYVNPQRDSDAAALEVHGLTTSFLEDKPLFADIAQEMLDFLGDAELIIHNAAFDIGFLDHELKLARAAVRALAKQCSVVDSLAYARQKHPGQANGLDALCRRYGVDNSARTLHGALLDAEILADVYLLMTGGQTALFAQDTDSDAATRSRQARPSRVPRPDLPVIAATATELSAHEALLDSLAAEAGQCAWRQLDYDQIKNTTQR